MQITILGAGAIGGSLVEHLVRENHDISVIDEDKEALDELKERLDIRIIHGHGSSPNILEQAGIKESQALIAVTNNDETNLIACHCARLLYQTGVTICRIRNESYFGREDQLFGESGIPIDVIIRPENLVTRHIQHLIDYPNALGVLDFADGRAQLVGITAREGGPMIGKQVQAIHQHMPNAPARVSVIFRGEKTLLPQGDTIIEDKDEVMFITAREHIREVMSELRRLDKSYQNIIIAGGGRIGYRVAATLQKDHTVKVLEHNRQRCQELSMMLQSKTLVLHSNAANENLLNEEGIDKADVFLAITNDDETNIMASRLAKKLGAKRVMTLITNPAYVQLSAEMDIDVVISPSLITIGSILNYLHEGNIVVSAQLLHGGTAEALELIVRGDSQSSKLVGKTIEEVPWPEGSTPAAIIRGRKTLMPLHDTMIEPMDRIIIITTTTKKIAAIEELFWQRKTTNGN